MILNKNEFPPLLAAWLVEDTYHYINNPKYISATSIIRPTREIILSSRVKDEKDIDLNTILNSKIGSATHDALQNLWTSGNYKKSLKLLGYPDKFIESIKVNPEEPNKEDTNVYVEQRYFRKLNGWTIGGQFDIVFNGQLNDYKTTSTLSYLKQSRKNEYILQGSIYRWLYPDIITSDTVAINYIFTDWSKVQANSDPNYPANKCIKVEYPLISLKEIEEYLVNKLRELDAYWDKEENKIPHCPTDSLWMSPTVYKYYSNPLKTTGRSTKNFDNLEEAYAYWYQTKQGKGTIITQAGEPRKCKYCNAYPICTQRRTYFND